MLHFTIRKGLKDYCRGHCWMEGKLLILTDAMDCNKTELLDMA